MLRLRNVSFSRIGLLILGFVSLAIANGTRQGYGVFLPGLIKEFDSSNAKLAGAFSIIHLINGFFAPLVGSAIDNYPPRIIFVTGTFLVSTAFVLLGFATEVWQIYGIIIIVMALGISCIGLTAVNTLITRSFHEKRGTALGFVAMGSGVGTFFFLFISSLLINWIGWRKAFWFWGGLQLLILLPLILIFLDKTEKGACSKEPVRLDNIQKEVSIPWLNLNFILILCSVLLFTMSNFIYLMYLVAYAKSQGISYIYSAQALSLVGISNALGSLMIAVLSDFFANRSKALVLSISLVTASFFLLMIFPISNSVILLNSFIFGLGMGGYYPIMPALVGEFFGQKRIGTIYGSTLLLGGIGAFIGPVIGGIIYDLSGDYSFTFTTALLFTLGALVFSIILVKQFNKKFSDKQDSL